MFSFFKKHIEMCSQRAFLEKLYHLRRNEDHLLATIAVNSFDNAIHNIDRAYLNQEFIVDNMFEGILLALGCLNAGERFHGISAIINPDHWLHDEHLIKYKELNYQKIAEGVEIQRIFILQNQTEIELMTNIMNEQVENGVDVRYCLEDDLKHVSFFPDVTILPERKSVLYVPNLNKLMQCYVSNNPKVVKDIQKDYENIRKKAQKWKVK